MFVDQEGRQMRLGQLNDVLQRTLKRAGLRKVRWHDLRHSFASHLVAAGVPLNLVQARLGHTTIAMTMRYAHLAPDHVRQFVSLAPAPADQNGQRAGKTGKAESALAKSANDLN